MDSVEKRMEGARDISMGTMPMGILFNTDEEVKAAREWMKGKRRVKNLHPMTHEENERIKEEHRVTIAEKLGVAP